MKRYYYDQDEKRMLEWPEGQYVKYSDVEELIDVLKKIAEQDYRGNRPQSAVDAYEALKKLGVE